MPKRDDRLLLQDIFEAGSKIIEFTTGYSFDNYINDNRTVDAVLRNFEVIGEASKLLSESLIKQHTEIEWRKMVGLRNILIHDYFGINHALVWETIHNYLPRTMASIKQLIDEHA